MHSFLQSWNISAQDGESEVYAFAVEIGSQARSATKNVEIIIVGSGAMQDFDSEEFIREDITEEEYAELDKSVYGMNDIIGKSGLESAYESVLKGKDGKVKITYDANGEIISEEVIEEAVPGATVMVSPSTVT